MSKLDPKPVEQNPLYGWSYLNEHLQSNFKKADKENVPSLTIDLSSYEMTKEEIKSETEKVGYKVIDNNDGYLVFK